MKKIDIVKLDWEERFGLPSAGGTSVGKLLPLLWGMAFTAVFYALLALFRLYWSNCVFLNMFFPGGPEMRTFIPGLTVYLSMSSLAMLLLKRSKLKIQQKALAALPSSGNTAEKLVLLSEIFRDIDDFAAAVLMKKYLQLQTDKLSALEIAGIMDSHFDDLEKECENSFIPVSCFIWAIPVLGFIGTVIGLAAAVGNFGELTNSGSTVDFQNILPQVTGGLATAFETTLIALTAALLLQIISSFQNQSELRWIMTAKKQILDSNSVANGGE